MAWWSVPLVAFVAAVVWVSLASRPRPRADPHDSMAEHERFRQAMGRQVAPPPLPGDGRGPAVDKGDEQAAPPGRVYPEGETVQRVERESPGEMLQSQAAAAVAALGHLHLPVPLTVSVADVTKGSPADGKLRNGERILAVDGTGMSTGAQV